MMLKYQKSGDTALDFTLKDITQIFNQNASQGMLTIQLTIGGDENNNKNSINNSAKSNFLQRNVMLGSTAMSGLHQHSSGGGTQYKLFLSKMEPQLVLGFCNLLREEVGKTTTSPRPVL